MKFMADESVDYPIIELLRTNGFDVKSISEDSPSVSDDVVLDLTNNEGRILITLDKDFGDLVYRLKTSHHGIILVRLSGVKPSEKAIIVLNNIKTHGEELRDAFTVIQIGMTRIRKN